MKDRNQLLCSLQHIYINQGYWAINDPKDHRQRRKNDYSKLDTGHAG